MRESGSVLVRVTDKSEGRGPPGLFYILSPLLLIIVLEVLSRKFGSGVSLGGPIM